VSRARRAGDPLAATLLPPLAAPPPTPARSSTPAVAQWALASRVVARGVGGAGCGSLASVCPAAADASRRPPAGHGHAPRSRPPGSARSAPSCPRRRAACSRTPRGCSYTRSAVRLDPLALACLAPRL